MIWLLDISVQVERAADGRTGRVCVLDNDADPNGEQQPLAQAKVLVETRLPGRVPTPIAQGYTDANGLFGFATPSNLPAAQIAVTVDLSGRNTRHLLLDGTPIVLDLREFLYHDRG